METAWGLLGRTLRKRRRELGLSQEQVARAAGKTQAQVSDVERGVDDPRLSTMLQVTRSLRADLVVVPSHLLPHVLQIVSGTAGSGAGRLVGNDPEDADVD